MKNIDKRIKEIDKELSDLDSYEIAAQNYNENSELRKNELNNRELKD